MMQNSKDADYTELRKYVSKLYINVLTERMNIREALSRFPKNCEDKTIITAWHALCHLEADEDLRKKDKMYAKEQEDYIEYIAFTLDKGEELPQNIIEAYMPYYDDALTPYENTVKGFFHRLKKFLCCPKKL